MNMESGIKSQQHKEAEINRTELYKKIDAGVKFAIANAIERHRRLGESIREPHKKDDPISPNQSDFSSPCSLLPAPLPSQRRDIFLVGSLLVFCEMVKW